ncbi:unnamed protein product [Tilletia controversa]|uniref:Uncharacterized protein n=1 Tax=Tilletia controversa TaxID=13291 RepID=A0A8X7SWI2_9BASI|nr:hypothetical protein CF328_g3617 [Tilletia controversa]KAE8247469.1 hypothetical protein A4X06_0g4432 [Tilletia controversa]CAD6905918.1 unnamed protein product [Tilletia controversa]
MESSSSRVLGGGSKRGRGGAHQRVGLHGGPSSSSSNTIPASASVLDLQPRFQKQRKQGSKGGDPKVEGTAPEKIKRLGGTSFIDRAALRRRGINDPAELEAEDDADDGSRPSKGLDIESLGKDQAPQGSSGTGPPGVLDDEDLEQAFQSAATGEKKPDEGNEAEIPADSVAPKSRQDIIAALSRRKARGQGTAPTTSAGPSTTKSADEIARARSQGKFKPIGFKSVSSGTAQGADDKDYVVINGKRMRKKKKKEDIQNANGDGGDGQAAAQSPVVRAETSNLADKGTFKASAGDSIATSEVEDLTSAPGRASTKPVEFTANDSTDQDRRSGEPADNIITENTRSEDIQMDIAPPVDTPLESAIAASTSAVQPEAVSKKEDNEVAVADNVVAAEGLVDDDEDIFAEADEWQGLAIDSEEEGDAPTSSAQKDTTTNAGTEPALSTTPLPSESQPARRDWFGSSSEQTTRNGPDKGKGKAGEEDEDALSRAMREANEAAAKKAQAEAEAAAAAAAPAAETSTARLTGLSDSALPSDMSRLLLEREREREAGGGAAGSFRKGRKTKEGEDGAGEDDDDDDDGGRSGAAPRKRKRKRKGKGGGGDDDD